jgi:large subunit ribosomal protein L29
MKASKFREMSSDELQFEETTLRERLFKLRFQTATGQIESASRMKGVRQDIARIKTILREIELKKN